MISKLLKSVRQYTKHSILSLVFIIGEVVLEVVIPFITADMVNKIQGGVDMSTILKMGGIITVCAIMSLVCGALAGNYSAKASAGFGPVRSFSAHRLAVQRAAGIHRGQIPADSEFPCRLRSRRSSAKSR